MGKPLERAEIAAPRGFKQRLYAELEPAARHKPGLSVTNRIICVLIIASALFAVMETEHEFVGNHVGAFLAIEMAITAVFAIEYLLRAWVSSESPTYGPGLKGLARYLTSPAAILDLIALAPIVFALAGSQAFLLRAFRLLRILRVARLGRFSRATRYMRMAVAARREELVLSLGVAILLIFASSTLLYLVEGGLQPKQFGSIPRAMWWSVSTLTTVGYGDVYPITALGRILAGLTAIAGIGLIAMPAGILASAFSEAARREHELIEEERRGEWRPE